MFDQFTTRQLIDAANYNEQAVLNHAVRWIKEA